MLPLPHLCLGHHVHLSLSLRVLFALARGIPIVTTDWVTECSSKLVSRVVSTHLYVALNLHWLTPYTSPHLTIRLMCR